MTERPNICYIFEKLRVQGCQIWHSHVSMPFHSAPAHSTRPHNAKKKLFSSSLEILGGGTVFLKIFTYRLKGPGAVKKNTPCITPKAHFHFSFFWEFSTQLLPGAKSLSTLSSTVRIRLLPIWGIGVLSQMSLATASDTSWSDVFDYQITRLVFFLLRNRGWRDSYFNFQDEIEILFPSVSFLETRKRIFSLNLRVRDEIENFVHLISGFEQRDREFL